jgi:hypothetical protein
MLQQGAPGSDEQSVGVRAVRRNCQSPFGHHQRLLAGRPNSGNSCPKPRGSPLASERTQKLANDPSPPDQQRDERRAVSSPTNRQAHNNAGSHPALFSNPILFALPGFGGLAETTSTGIKLAAGFILGLHECSCG